MTARTLRTIGWVLYIASYWLPAVGNPDHIKGESLRGYFCAFISLVWGVGGLFTPLTPEGRTWFLSLLLPGLANVLLVPYIVLLIRQRTDSISPILAVIIAVFAASSVIPILLGHLFPYVGCYAWFASLVIMTWPDLAVAATSVKSRFLTRTIKPA